MTNDNVKRLLWNAQHEMTNYTLMTSNHREIRMVDDALDSLDRNDYIDALYHLNRAIVSLNDEEYTPVQLMKLAEMHIQHLMNKES